MEVIEIKGAKNFIKAISFEKTSITGRRASLRDYIFRGQREAEWEALPSAFRDEASLVSLGGLSNLTRRTNRDQIEAEFYMLSKFCDELNRNGFHLPNEDLLNIDTDVTGFTKFVTEIGRGEAVWPPKSFHSLIAIAQHYGIPTRFLDFSYDPMVALYFAVTDAIKYCDSDFISVYAVCARGLNVRSFDFKLSREDEDFILGQNDNRFYQMVKSPTSFNHNLRNQKGLFLAYVENNFKANDGFSPESLDKYLERTEEGSYSYKFKIKSSEAVKLLKLLHDRFYSASSLFPSVEGCVKGLYEQHV